MFRALRRSVLGKGVSQKARWRLVLKKKMMLGGLILLALNVIVAAFAPHIAWHDPVTDFQVADNFAFPAWMGIFPGYEDLPRNMLSNLEANDWKIDFSGKDAARLRISAKSPDFAIIYDGTGSSVEGEAQAVLTYEFNYPYAPPKTFFVRIPMNICLTGAETLTYRFKVSLVRVGKGVTFTIYDSYPPWRSVDFVRWGESHLVLHSRDARVARQAGVDPLYENVAEKIFSEKGVYQLTIGIYVKDSADTGTPTRMEAIFGPATLRIPGLLYGMLGTTNMGADIFSQLVYGARISLAIGILAAIFVVALGFVIGVAAGYLGGAADQAIMFATDTLMQIPNLPIILVVMLVFGRNIWIIVAIISLLSWMGVARQFRAWVLSLKERPFVEAARAAGGSDAYIAFKVIGPQLVPVLAYYLAMRVPIAVGLEAGLSMLGFGDPYFPSWGKIMNECYNFGGFSKLAWWWIAPPITALLLFTLSFVMIGWSLEEIYQPRLRRR